MPTYSYRCDNEDCNHAFDERQSISADALTGCPKCQKDTLRRLIVRGGGVIFKGNGFYCTDYKNIKPPKGLDGSI